MKKPTSLSREPGLFAPQVEAVVGLFLAELSKGVSNDLTQLLRIDDDLELQLGAYENRMRVVYDEHLAGQSIVSFEQFEQAVYERLQRDIEQQGRVVVMTHQGLTSVDATLADKLLAKQNNQLVKQCNKEQIKKIQRAQRQRYTTAVREREWQISKKQTPHLSREDFQQQKSPRIRRFSRQTQRLFANYIQEYTTRRELHGSDRGRHWLRVIAGFLHVHTIKLHDWTEFGRLKIWLQKHWEIPEDLIVEGSQLLERRRAIWQKLYYPKRYLHLTSDELDAWREKIDATYTDRVPSGYRSYVGRLYKQMTDIIYHGQSTQEFVEQELRKASNYTPRQETDPPPSAKQLDLTEESPEFAHNQLTSKRKPKVDYIEAVNRVVSPHPDRLEQTIIRQLFHRMNYFHRWIKPLPKQMHEQALRGYRERHDKKIQEENTLPHSPVQPTFATDQLVYGGERIEDVLDFIIARVGQ